MGDNLVNESEVKTKWSVLRLIRAQSGTVNWYPVVTFFPRGTILEDPTIDGMDVIQEFVEQGLVTEQPQGSGFPAYAITAAGLEKLAELDACCENRASTTNCMLEAQR
jgi:hypothetical protein